jgi:hypothetical protein
MSDTVRTRALNDLSTDPFRNKVRNRTTALRLVQPARASHGAPECVVPSSHAQRRRMITVECHVGVLIELRFEGTPSLDDVERFKAETATLVSEWSALCARRVVLCTDLRATQLFAPDVASRIIDLMRSDNPRIERNGVLGNESAIFTLQVQRLLIEARSPGRRRIFTDTAGLEAWLAESLTPDESVRLRQFLAGPRTSPP